MIRSLLWVAGGGAIGSVLRFVVGKWLPSSSSFPWGTFVVNVVGCFLIGILWALSMRSSSFPDHIKLFLMTGICGGFTTFSSFSIENITLLREGKISLFLIYSLGSLVLGFLATFSAIKLLDNN